MLQTNMKGAAPLLRTQKEQLRSNSVAATQQLRAPHRRGGRVEVAVAKISLAVAVAEAVAVVYNTRHTLNKFKFLKFQICCVQTTTSSSL